MYKRFLLGLLILISITQIFTSPGINHLEIFQNFLENNNFRHSESLLRLFYYYPPGLFTIYSFLSRINNPILYKILLAFAYYVNFYAFYRMAISSKFAIKKSLLDLGILYFAAVNILVLAVSLSFPQIIASFFLMISISFVFKKKVWLASEFYLLCILFDWRLSILGPIIYFSNMGVRNYPRRIYQPLILFLIPSSVFVTFSLFEIIYTPSRPNFSNVSINFPSLIESSTRFVENFSNYQYKNIFAISIGLASFFSFFIFIYLVWTTINSKNKRNKVLGLMISLVSLGIVIESINFVSISLFLLFYIVIVLRIFKKNNSRNKFFFASFLILILYFLLNSFVNIGFLIYLSLVSILLTKKKAFAINLSVFILTFSYYGTSGLPPVRGIYFEILRLMIVLTILFYFLYLFKENWLILLKPVGKVRLKIHKKYVVLLMLLVNLALITATGSPDTVSWSQYSLASVEAHGNPFIAQTMVDQRYPPLATAILSIFAYTWKNIVGPDQRYAVSTKLSIFVFYVISLIVIYMFNKLFSKRKLDAIDKLLVLLTSFSLIVQTQGLADVNIQLIPTLFLAMVALFKRKYFWAGILMGVTMSIKWQPVILLPLFGATIFNLNDLKNSLKNTLKFLIGFIPIPVITWLLVLVQPGGMEAFGRATEYLLHGAPMLSGQALNLGWIVTYYIHIFRPELDYSLLHLGYLNRQVPTGVAPTIFQGYLFIGVAFFIFLFYWLFQKKNISNFVYSSIMIFFTHYMLNKSAYEKHIFYVVIFTLLLYMVKPTNIHKRLLVLFDIMTAMNLIFFYGFTGDKWVNRLFFRVDLTVIFSFYYLLIYLWVLWRYFRNGPT